MVTQTHNRTTSTNKTTAAKAPAPGAKTGSRKPAAPKRRIVGAATGQRQQLIAEAAYYIAERRGFSPGSELDDWLQAEREVELQMQSSLH